MAVIAAAPAEYEHQNNDEYDDHLLISFNSGSHSGFFDPLMTPFALAPTG
jgi:hypothetical protein